MGCASSSPVKDGPASPNHSKPKSAPVQAARKASTLPAPDAMLEPHWTYIKGLGKGGSGDTGLFRPTGGGDDVAIKLIKRPLPKVAMPNILREITVRKCHSMYPLYSISSLPAHETI